MLSRLAALCLCCACVMLLGGPDTRPGYGAEPEIAPSDLFSDRDLGALGTAARQQWLPPSQDYVAAHEAEAEHPDMRAEFSIWVRSLVAPSLLPEGVVDAAPYLKHGTARESRALSYFYATYAVAEMRVMAKGYFARVEATIKPPASDIPEAVARAFSEARALQDAHEPGMLGAPEAYGGPPRELLSYLRAQAEALVNPASLPQSEAEWQRALSTLCAYNGGFWVNWLSNGYKQYVPEAARDEYHDSALCVLWANGRVVRLVVDHCVSVHSFADWLDSFPKPRPAPVAPLNPQAVELWDMAEWNGPDGPVDDPSRATGMIIRVVVKAPYAPNVGVEMSGPETGGQPWYGNEVKLPLSELQWHIAEFTGLMDGANLAAGEHAYPDTFADDLGKAADRGKLLEEARGHRDTLAEVVDRYSTLLYPREVQPERDRMVDALRAGLQAWNAALTFWEPVVQQAPDASEAFYQLRGETLKQELVAAGLTHTRERIGQVVTGTFVPLFRKYGMQ